MVVRIITATYNAAKKLHYTFRSVVLQNYARDIY